MTARASPPQLARVLDRASDVLVDFDGPICSIFAGLSSATVADQLRSILVANHVVLPPSLTAETDPLQVLRYTAGVDLSLTSKVEAALRHAEVIAAQCARSTAHARDALLACRRSGRRVAVVSNNSQAAVDAYLRTHGIATLVDRVVGRTIPDPSLLKPNPHLLLEAAAALDISPACGVLVGDSVTDMEAARAAGSLSIGLANKPAKRERLVDAGADAVIDTMAQLASALLTRHQRT